VASNAVRLTTGPSLADQAYDVLRGLITSGELAPGERLTERGLAARLGVSPTPVREAISRLAHERLLVRLDGRTLQVAAPSLRRLREMSLIHAALNGVAARLAAEYATDEELAAIVETHRRSTQKSAQPHAKGLRHEFHQQIVDASHNPSLIGMIATAEAFGRPMRERAQRAAGAAESIRQAVDEHQAIIEALRVRDGDRAETLAREHALWIGERYLEFAERETIGQPDALGDGPIAS
jgi:DNA-binding GntR family transcriptional regulator